MSKVPPALNIHPQMLPGPTQGLCVGFCNGWSTVAGAVFKSFFFCSVHKQMAAKSFFWKISNYVDFELMPVSIKCGEPKQKESSRKPQRTPRHLFLALSGSLPPCWFCVKSILSFRHKAESQIYCSLRHTVKSQKRKGESSPRNTHMYSMMYGMEDVTTKAVKWKRWEKKEKEGR